MREFTEREWVCNSGMFISKMK